MKAKLITISLASLIALLAVWGVLVSFDWVQEYFATKQNPAYQELPFEFKLKADAKDVIYSEAYTTGDGKNIVRYAYVTGEVGPQLNEDISRRTPESYTEVVEKFENEEGKPMETLKTTFVSKPQFYQQDGRWRQIEYATTTAEVFSMSGAIPYIKRREWVEWLIPGSAVYATVSTFYPDPHTESTSVDGYITSDYTPDTSSVVSACGNAKSAGTRTFSDTTIGASAVASYNATDNPPILENFGEDVYGCTLYRSFILFDTSSIPDTASISAATISLYVTSATNYLSDSIAINTSSPASNTALATSDFGSVGSSDMATRVSISSITTSAYNTFTLNSSGRSQVNVAGVSKFSVRVNEDVDDSFDLIFSGIVTVGINFSTADTSGTSQDPKLEVTYTTPSTFSMGMWFPF